MAKTAAVKKSSPAFDARDIAYALIGADSEADVQDIIMSDPFMRDPKNWRPLDNRETNFNVTSNQASDGGKALTELMTNMVDAVLMKHAYQKGINPKGPKAPKTMYEAVDKLVTPLHGGKLIHLDQKDPWLTDFAKKNLIIGVTGAKNKKEGLPCYTFVDNGEGQEPEDFKRTFLSLSEGNKKSIPFVQGKYNMGSSGVLGYCGLRWFKLIVSRRFDGKSPWGLTLMRKRPGGGMPVAEYFVLPDGTIPSFDDDMIYPFTKKNGKRYDGVCLSTGTIIKLYDYQIGAKYMGFRGSREAMNENLVETILPFRIMDFRWTPDPKRGGDRAEGIDTRGFCGMEFLLLRTQKSGETGTKDETETEEDDDEYAGVDEAVGTGRIAVDNIEHPTLGKIDITAIPLKQNLPGWLAHRVFHSVNGQVQFKQTRGYVSQSCGFPALKDRVVIIVDASNLTFEAHNDVWKGDREFIRNTIVGELYKETVTQAIRQSKALKKLQEEIAKEEMEHTVKSERNDLFQALVNEDPDLAALLSDQEPTLYLPSSGGSGKTDKDKGKDERFKGKYSPTRLKIEEKTKTNGIRIPINRTRPIAAETDAENGYLQRPDNRGRILIDDNVRECFGIRAQLVDGRLTIYLEPLQDTLKVGDKFRVTLGLQDDSMPQPVTDTFTIYVDEEEEKQKKKKKKKKDEDDKKYGDQGDKPGEGEPKPTHGLPPFRLLTKDGRPVGKLHSKAWPNGFNEYDGGYVEDLDGKNVICFINYDNVYHQRARIKQREGISREVVTEKYILGMRILMLGFERSMRALTETMDKDKLGEFNDECRRISARGAAATVLALTESLPKIVDASSVQNVVE